MKSIANSIKRMLIWCIKVSFLLIIFYSFFADPQTRGETIGVIEDIGAEVGDKMAKQKKNAVANFKSWDMEKSIKDLQKSMKETNKRVSSRKRKRSEK